jgi:hypothetical protein
MTAVIAIAKDCDSHETAVPDVRLTNGTLFTIRAYYNITSNNPIFVYVDNHTTLCSLEKLST